LIYVLHGPILKLVNLFNRLRQPSGKIPEETTSTNSVEY
jgi:hypothetical protein